MPELMIMIKGMAAAMRSAFFTLRLLIISLYVFAIGFVQMADAEVDDGLRVTYFTNVSKAMYTLLLYGALLDGIRVLSDALQHPEKGGSIIIMFAFFFFVLLPALTVMNMLIWVLCEVVSAVAASEREEMLAAYVRGKLRTVVQGLDKDNDEERFPHIVVGNMVDDIDILEEHGDRGKISRIEFEAILDNQQAGRGGAIPEAAVGRGLRRSLPGVGVLGFVKSGCEQLCEKRGHGGRFLGGMQEFANSRSAAVASCSEGPAEQCERPARAAAPFDALPRATARRPALRAAHAAAAPVHVGLHLLPPEQRHGRRHHPGRLSRSQGRAPRDQHPRRRRRRGHRLGRVVADRRVRAGGQARERGHAVGPV